MGDKVLATICIPATRLDTTLVNCLSGLKKQTNTRFVVYIVVMKNEPLLKKLIQNFPFSIKVVVQKKPGLVSAVNSALNMTKTEFFIRIDDDIFAEEQWFDEIISTFHDKTVGAVTGPTLIPKTHLRNRDVLAFIQKFQNSRNIFFWPLKKLYFSYLYENRLFCVATFLKHGAFTIGSNFQQFIPKNKISVDNLEACNFAVRTNLLNSCGGFDQTFSVGLGEYHEADIACKIRKLGSKIIYNPCAIVHHLVEKGVYATRHETYHRMLNFMKFYHRHFKITSIDTLLKWSIYLLFQNCYYIFVFLRSGDVSHLKSFPATLTGFKLFFQNAQEKN